MSKIYSAQAWFDAYESMRLWQLGFEPWKPLEHPPLTDLFGVYDTADEQNPYLLKAALKACATEVTGWSEHYLRQMLKRHYATFGSWRAAVQAYLNDNWTGFPVGWVRIELEAVEKAVKGDKLWIDNSVMDDGQWYVFMSSFKLTDKGV